MSSPQAIVPPEHAAHGHGVPELRGVAAHVRIRQRRIRPAHRQGRRTPRSATRVARMLDAVGLQGLEQRHPGQLSGGQQQRVALARSLVVEPSILLLDEPLSNLDAKLRERMRAELKTLQRRTGITFIYVTHDQAEAMALSDRIVVFNKGRGAAGRHAARRLRAPGQSVRRRFHGAGEQAARHASSAGMAIVRARAHRRSR